MRVVRYLLDVLVSTLRMMRLAMFGLREAQLCWVAFETGAASARRIWWVGHAMSASPATVAVARSADGRELFVHTCFRRASEREAFIRSSCALFGLPRGRTIDEAPSDRGPP